MNQIAILASGQGTTAEAFIRAGAEGRIDSNVSLVISNNPGAGIFERVAALNKEYKLNIKTACINGKTHPAKPGETVRLGGQTTAEETALIELLSKGNYDLVALMGYMKMLGPKLVHEFGWRSQYTSPYQARMLNTHPGLLPATKGSYGMPAQQLSLDLKLPFGGQTLHVVAEDYDDGPTVAEHKVKILPRDTAEKLFARVQAIEKKTLPHDIDAFKKPPKLPNKGG